MTPSHAVATILLGLIAATALGAWAAPNPPPEHEAHPLGWAAFLYATPLVLAAVVVTGQRWALMAAVMYGTIGLALDLSTIVQEVTRGPGSAVVLLTSAVTGVLNFLLIVLGGRGVLGGPALRS